MADRTIPVDLWNPGQVFACLGFLEGAESLLGDAEGGFDWSDPTAPRFRLSAGGDADPVEAVLDFLAEAEAVRIAPAGYADPPAKGAQNDGADGEDDTAGDMPELAATFPAPAGDRMALPVRIGGGNRLAIELGHWADGSSRDSFKLYAGNRSANGIARAMLQGIRAKPTAKQKKAGLAGEIRMKGIRQLWDEDRATLLAAPFDVLTAMGGSFNFDPRGAWTAIDAGYSPNEHKHPVQASPVVEVLAAWGLEHARPETYGRRQVRYAVWSAMLPPMLARAALAGGIPALPQRRFRFVLDLSGKNKVVTFAEEEHP